MSQTSTKSLMLLGFKGGAIIAGIASLILFIRPGTPPQKSQIDPDQTATQTARDSHVSSGSPVAPWHRIEQDPGATRRFVKKKRTSNETFLEIYAVSGELRMEQAKELRIEAESGEDVMTKEDLERLGLPKHDAYTVIEKIENEGVVAW